MYIDEKPLARLEACNKLDILKYVGKEYKNRTVKLAFVRKNDMPYIPWGFGDINVKNEKLSETYRVGANGKYLLRMKDVSLLIKTFGSDKNIDMDAIADKTKEIIKTIGKPVLSGYFADTMVSAFEINSKIAEIREMMTAKIQKENIFAEMGLELKILTLDSIHINDEDMELIRNRINGTGKNVLVSDEDGVNDSNHNSLIDEIQALKNEVAKIVKNQDKDAILNEIDHLRNEMNESMENVSSNGNETAIKELSFQLNDLKRQIAQSKKDSDSSIKAAKMIEELDKKLSNKLDSSLSAIRSILENDRDEKIQNDLPLYETAKEEWIKKLKLTTDFLLEKAETDDDYACVAGLLYSNVEENLIDKFGIPHKGKNFYMPEEEFNELSKNITYDGRLLFKDGFKCKYLKYPTLKGTYVEMPLEIRFIKAGLSVEKACQAARDWTLINKLRHRSPENERYLDKTLGAMKTTKKEFLGHVLDSYRKLGLYTRD